MQSFFHGLKLGFWYVLCLGMSGLGHLSERFHHPCNTVHTVSYSVVLCISYLYYDPCNTVHTVSYSISYLYSQYYAVFIILVKYTRNIILILCFANITNIIIIIIFLNIIS